MADLAFNVDQAVSELSREADHRIDGLKQEAARLERELRAVAAAVRRGDGAGPVDVNAADIVHVFDVRPPHSMPSSFTLELVVYGNRIGESIQRQPLEAGKTYRAILLLTKVDDA